MNQPFLKKYQPKMLDEFFMDSAYIQLINTLIKMDNLKYATYRQYGLW